MKQNPSIVKVAAVCSALLLIASFVWYRGTGRLPFSSQPESPLAEDSAAPLTPIAAPPPQVMYGSKTMVITPSTGETHADDQRMMTSSKSGPVFESQDVAPAPAETQPDSHTSPPAQP